MKLFTTKQIATLDKYTIENEPVSDIDLMERASLQITNWLVQQFSTEQKMLFFAGPGNNGGDALAIARQMAGLDFVCEVYLMDFGKALTDSPKLNWQRLEEQGAVKLSRLTSMADFPEVGREDVLVDGLFGSGLSRPLQGFPAEVVQQINQLLNTVVAIDIPSGLMGEDNSTGIRENIIRADFTLTFQFPKVSFLFPENNEFAGDWQVLPIGLHPGGIEEIDSNFYFLEQNEVRGRMPVRSKFDHKGTLGHALLIAGSYGKMGAAVLASKACLRAGVGLLTVHVPHFGYSIIQTTVPEAMASIDQHDSMFTQFPDIRPFSAIGVGPGLGKKQNSKKALFELLETANVPLVIDADALNILSENQDYLKKLPEGSILTPHPGEFKRLVGDTANSFDRIQKQQEFSNRYNCIVVLKGAHTCISTPEGKLYFNSTGNPGMATAGSGDALTGIILGLLAQKMTSEDAAVLGVYLHGMAGDLAALKKSEFALVAGDIIDLMGEAFKKLGTGL
ncbi:NAD(P)H-hydrate dehydratase [Prolixibacteraceae bacterium Z1-6]|uniref:Bifunctional NAD(P)H-hydrate repair enzyme n=1 Tax=Draconibacterium aestuarii TaxID=2998507 RepID=A0A9X3F346_9BACT|nr:NAD(P)H-hydrate dehydratase [Prolixibacteraceae bacterium Z1-6]